MRELLPFSGFVLRPSLLVFHFSLFTKKSYQMGGAKFGENRISFTRRRRTGPAQQSKKGESKTMNIRSIQNAAAMLIVFAAGAINAFSTAPPNDNFANAEVLSGTRISVTRSNIDSTKEIGEPAHALNVGGKSVWFKWTAPSTAAMVFSTVRSDSNLDTIIHVYTGSGLLSLSTEAFNNSVSAPVNLRSAVRLYVRAGTVYYIAVDGNNSGQGAAAGTFKLDIKPSNRYHGADYDGDGLTDISVFRPSEGNWYTLRSATGQMSVQHYGTDGDIPVVAARSGEGNFPTVFRPSTGMWFGYHCCAASLINWGTAGDIPIPETFGNETSSNYTVFRPSNGGWYIYGHGGENRYYTFGIAGDIPVPGRYTPDMYADIAVFRPSTGVWYILQRISGLASEDSFRAVQFGQPGDKPAPGDYDGDGILDPAIYRPSTGYWWVLRSSDGQQHAFRWGSAEDIPVTGDYDGDGLFDFAVFRPSTGDWYIHQTSNQQARIQHFGTTGDIPVTSNVR